MVLSRSTRTKTPIESHHRASTFLISATIALAMPLAIMASLLVGCGRDTQPAPTLEEDEANHSGPLVAVGLERLDSASASVLVGKRLGLVVHSASRTDDGRHAIDVLRARGLDVARLFSPEHGLRGEAAAGETVDGGLDAESGLEIVSLYGRDRKPTPDHLDDLEALVFDLQGAGVRFYTYVSTMMLCLEAAAEAGIDFVVLDRPNPLGGARVEGPTRDAFETVPRSFVSLAPGPLVHGLTLGEMARFVNARRAEPGRLTVVPMSGWRREMTWVDTGRRWWPPSPNLRTPEAAIAYPGVALLESTNVSEGRGTDAPFLVLGAPWLEPAIELPAAPGFRLASIRFVTASSPAAPRPKYLGQTSIGWRVHVDDPRTAEPYRLGVGLLVALAAHEDFEWRQEGAALVWLLGTPSLLEAIRAGHTVDEIVERDRNAIDAWRDARAPALLYR